MSRPPFSEFSGSVHECDVRLWYPSFCAFGLTLYFSAEVTWPAGTYGLPKAKNGCPVSLKTNWTTGWRFEDLEDTRPGTRKSKSYHLDTKVGVDVNRTFCIKAKNNVSTEWPQGKLIYTDK